MEETEASRQPDDWSADLRSVLTALASTTYHWDLASDHIEWGGNAGAVLGLDDMGRFSLGQAWRKLLSTRSPTGRDEAISGSPDIDEGGGVPFHIRYEIVLPKGPVTIDDHGRWFAGVDGKPAIARGIVRVAQGSASAHQETGAAARGRLLRRIELAMAATRQHGKPFALLTGCLRDYRAIDSSHGSEDADALVQTALDRLQSAVRQTDTLVRYASNRFALLMGACPRSEFSSAAARLSAIVAAEPVHLDAGVYLPSISWGGVSDLAGAANPRQVLRRCEEAMHQARARGAMLVEYRQDRLRENRRLSEQAMAEEIVRALNDRRILIARQPIVEAKGRKLKFEEALVRMRREEGDIVAASAIVPVFEKLGRIDLLDHRMLELAIDTLIEEPDSSLSINVSTTTLLKDAWINTLSSALVGRSDIADRLIVELTESQAIEDFEATRKIFAKLKAMGLRTAIDDFGAGYTSFRHLRGLDVDVLKIDGAFVQNITQSADDSFFVRTLIDLAQHLNIATVAEWVRDEEAARRLASWGVTYLQGDVIGAARIGRREAESVRAA
ncbi:GGDEF domain-containing phosphodiesterase [Terrarubrum flagellatum]|uniref:EAL domain-containing protein n=1 Tax=Terrirubrum flagellatum TaxID=2895980 RepID=UPI003145037C